MEPFSVLMSVYRNDKSEDVQRAVESVTIAQSIKPDEIVIVVDGPVSEELSKLLVQFEVSPDYNFVIKRLPINGGLGNALRIGTESTKYDIIARMDSDDVSLPTRFEKQMEYLRINPECDIVGGQITEFIGDESSIVGKRIVPCDSKDIEEYIKSRCPFNHMTIMARKRKILEAGNYQELHFNEDYYLWIRMFENGCQFANLPDTLVNVRVGKEMYARRGGWKYFKSEKWLQDYMLKKHIIGLPRYFYNVLGRFGVQVLLPTKVRGFIFKTLFRKS